VQAIDCAPCDHAPRCPLLVVDLEARLNLFAVAVSREEAVLQDALLLVHQ
jgi:hypothetical protein